ncbi:MAG: M23 family metallopeptidase [Phycicoccus sp.]
MAVTAVAALAVATPLSVEARPAQAAVGDFHVPATGSVTGVIGRYCNGMAGDHSGIDIAQGNASLRTIVASAAGTVTRDAVDSVYGNVVEISHAGGYVSRYAHLASVNGGVDVGARVSQDQPIGVMGSTGLSTGVHLHFSITPSVGNLLNQYFTCGKGVTAGTAIPLSFPGSTSAGYLAEAASNNGWRNQGVGFQGSGILAESVAAIAVNGVKYVYTVNGGYVYEAASDNGWRNLATGIAGSSVAALTVNGVKYVYTVNGGYVHEAASNNAWRSLNTGVPASSVAATAVGDVKYLYAVSGGYVFEAASNNGWRSQGVGFQGAGIRADSVAAIAVNGVKYVYTVSGGYVHEAASNNGWRNLNSGIAGASVAALAVNGVKHVYTVSGGYVHEAASNNAWRNLSTGVPASSVAAIAVGDVKYLYSRS